MWGWGARTSTLSPAQASTERRYSATWVVSPGGLSLGRRIVSARMSTEMVAPAVHFRPQCRLHPNEASVVRLIGALLMEQDEEWLTGRRYVDMNAYWEWQATREAETDSHAVKERDAAA